MSDYVLCVLCGPDGCRGEAAHVAEYGGAPCDCPALDVGGVTPRCERPRDHAGLHARTIVEDDGRPHVYRWGTPAGHRG